MQHVVTAPIPPVSACGGAARLHAVPLAVDNLGWVLECVATGACAVVDGPPDPALLRWLDASGLRLAAVWNTHTHGDHVGVNALLAEAGRLDGVEVAGPAVGVPHQTRVVGEGDAVRVGEVSARVWLTEGHLDGHLSYVLDGAVLCGDTLFAGGCGFLFDGPPEKMLRSLLRLAELPGDTAVCCAHEYTLDNLRFAWSVEPDNAALAERIRRVRALRAAGQAAVPSTIEEERATNPFLRPGSRSIVAAAHLDGAPTPLAVFAAIRHLKDVRAYRRLTDEALPA